jgi:hypothetical protein
VFNINQCKGIAEALTSIDGQYTYVRGFDSTGAKSYNNTPFSDMKYMALDMDIGSKLRMMRMWMKMAWLF